MKSGLYAGAGASATASAAACANRFDDPMTKRSNVYLGLSSTSGASRNETAAASRTASGASGGWVTDDARADGRSLTAKVTTAPVVADSPAALATRSRKWPSIQSRVKSLGTSTTS